jgi:hypothetical protein
MVNRLYRTAELRPAPSFDLDEGNRCIPLDNQIDVAVSASEASLDHPPTAPPKPPLRYSLSKLPKRLPGH